MEIKNFEEIADLLQQVTIHSARLALLLQHIEPLDDRLIISFGLSKIELFSNGNLTLTFWDSTTNELVRVSQDQLLGAIRASL